MAKGRQLVVRIDDDLAQVVEESAKSFNRSQAAIVCASLNAFAKLSAEARRAVLIEYATRDIPGAESGKSKRSK